MTGRHLAVAVLVLGMPLAGSSSARAGTPEMSAAAVITADGVTVHFSESGLDAHEPVSISVTALKKATSECVTAEPAPRVLFNTTSSASAAEVIRQVADAGGRISASQHLGVTAALPEVQGLPCAIRASYRVTAVVSDLSHGVSVTVERSG